MQNTFTNVPGKVTNITLIAQPERNWRQKLENDEPIRRHIVCRGIFTPEGSLHPACSVRVTFDGGTIENPILIHLEALTEDGKLKVYPAAPYESSDGEARYLRPRQDDAGNYLLEVDPLEEAQDGRKYPAGLLPQLLQTNWDFKVSNIGNLTPVTYVSKKTGLTEQAMIKGLPLYQASDNDGFTLADGDPKISRSTVVKANFSGVAEAPVLTPTGVEAGKTKVGARFDG